MNIAFQKSNDLKHVSMNLLTSIVVINHSTLIDENRDLPSLSDITLDPFSQENKNLVVDAVHLHDNCNLSPTQKRELESLSGNTHMSKNALILVMPKPGTPHHMYCILTVLLNCTL